MRISTSDAQGPRARLALGGDWIFANQPAPPKGCLDGHRKRTGREPQSSGAARGRAAPVEWEPALMRRLREAAPTRRVLCAIASRVVESRCAARLGYARARDYATERAGLSLRALQEMARVHDVLARAPQIEAAFVSGRLGWTRLRALSRLDRIEDEALWLGRAKALTVAELERAVRRERARVGEPSEGVEAGEDDEPGDRVPVVCARPVRAKWSLGCELARRVAGRRIPVWECGEVMAAELSSSLPVDPVGPADLDEEVGRGTWLGAALTPTRGAEGACDGLGVEGSRASTTGASTTRTSETGAGSALAEPPCPESPAPLPEPLASLFEGLDAASPFELDRRLRRAVHLERTHEARLGPLLRDALERRRYRLRGYWDRDRYVEERLGLCPRKVRALVRIERLLGSAPALADAYRAGRLSWVQTQALAPLVEAGLRGAQVGAWVAWAQGVSVRRLEDDARAAGGLADTDPTAFERTGGLPEEIGRAGTPDRQIGAHERAGAARQIGAHPTTRQIGAPPTHAAAPEDATVSYYAPPESARFFRAVLDTLRRRLESLRGERVTEGQALEAMLDHVIRVWGERDPSVRREHRILERDGYRCAVPGCSSHRNLQVHHVVFRSRGGSDAPENRIALCAWHHQRGIHGGLVRCTGTAPDGLRFELGLREGGPPLIVYEPGERIGEYRGTVGR